MRMQRIRQELDRMWAVFAADIGCEASPHEVVECAQYLLGAPMSEAERQEASKMEK